MLPDIPNANSYVKECLIRILYRRIAIKTGWMQYMNPPEPIREGRKVIFYRYDGSKDDVPMKLSKGKMTIKCDDLEKKGLPVVLEALEQVATDMANQQSKQFTERINDICKESGQVIDNQGRPLTFETILKLLESIDIDFDEQGQPKMPSIVAGPKLAAKIKDLNPTDEQKKRENEIIDRKFSEWRDRESSRRLVD
jgi:hypothetical protein